MAILEASMSFLSAILNKFFYIDYAIDIAMNSYTKSYQEKDFDKQKIELLAATSHAILIGIPLVKYFIGI